VQVRFVVIPYKSFAIDQQGATMKIKRIEHVGVVVRNLEASKRLWEDCLGIPLGGVEHTPGRPHKLALYPIGESMVELLAGIEPDSKFAKMCDEGKAGINHLCFDQVPRIGHAGCRIAYLDPKGTDGCLIELAELPKEPAHP
jgi:methylmalonyl-CoA/ethylmalonyl-CoA epimerase